MKNRWQASLPDAALIIFITLVAYIPVFHNGFVVDDVLITNNRLIRAGDGLYRFWFTTEAQDYYPITWSLWWFEWRFWGLDPTGYHVANMLMHAMNAVLLCIVLQQLNVPGAWLAGLAFAIHPVNVATAAWIAEQKNTVSLFFSALAVLLYLRFDKAPRPRWYLVSLFAFLLALLSKTAVAMLPVALLGCVWWRRGALSWKDVQRTLPFFVLSLVLGIVAIWFQNVHVLSKIPGREDGFLARLILAGSIPWFYLSKAVLPVHLTFVYPKWNIDPARWLSYLPGAILVGLFLLFWSKRREWGRPLLFGFGYFVVMLFPVLGFFDQSFYRVTLVADHWQYYSIIGIIALAVAMEQGIVRLMSAPGRNAMMLTSLIVLGGLGAATWMRCNVYKNPETLWRDNVIKNPGSWIAHYNLGLALWKRGDVDNAIHYYRQALSLKPDYTEPRNNLGVALAANGDLDDAIKEFREALRLSPNNAEAHNNLGLALARQGQTDDAIRHYEQAIHIRPDYATAYKNLGNALLHLGRTQDAIEKYEQALRIDPNDPEARDNLLTAEAARNHPAPLSTAPGQTK